MVREQGGKSTLKGDREQGERGDVFPEITKTF
jgi:hypothetical protein